MTTPTDSPQPANETAALVAKAFGWQVQITRLDEWKVGIVLLNPSGEIVDTGDAALNPDTAEDVMWDWYIHDRHLIPDYPALLTRLQQAERERGLLAEALKPFAHTGENLTVIEKHGQPADYEYHINGLNLTFEDFKAAYDVMNKLAQLAEGGK